MNVFTAWMSLIASSSFFYRGVDNVDDLMAEIAEQQELAYEISDAISKPYGFNEEFDEVRIHQKVSPCHKLKVQLLLCIQDDSLFAPGVTSL